MAMGMAIAVGLDTAFTDTMDIKTMVDIIMPHNTIRPTMATTPTFTKVNHRGFVKVKPYFNLDVKILQVDLELVLDSGALE